MYALHSARHFSSLAVYYGIIGYPLSHSFSPAYFRKKFADMHISARYDAMPLQAIDNLPALLETKPDLAGLNVTIPYKEAVIPYLHEIDEVVAVTGACNCIAIRNGYRKGYNTDVVGFEQSLIPLLAGHHSRALVLGTGGSSRAVRYVLSQLGIPFTQVSREAAPGCITWENLTADIVARHRLIVNTTPVGMYPDIEAILPMPWDALTGHHLLYDLIYNPEETTFLREGRLRGAVTKNGFEMLQIQAEASWDIWTQPH